MKRRDFLAAAAAVSVAFAGTARAEPLNYSEGLVEQRLAKGETVFLDFKASWCSTCKAQERVINALKADNPAYEKAVTFINVDWDTYKSAPLTVMLNIPRRSTLVVLKGDDELGRIVAGTSKAEIQALMDVALKAAAGS